MTLTSDPAAAQAVAAGRRITFRSGRLQTNRRDPVAAAAAAAMAAEHAQSSSAPPTFCSALIGLQLNEMLWRRRRRQWQDPPAHGPDTAVRHTHPKPQSPRHDCSAPPLPSRPDPRHRAVPRRDRAADRGRVRRFSPSRTRLVHRSAPLHSDIFSAVTPFQETIPPRRREPTF